MTLQTAQDLEGFTYHIGGEPFVCKSLAGDVSGLTFSYNAEVYTAPAAAVSTITAALVMAYEDDSTTTPSGILGLFASLGLVLEDDSAPTAAPSKTLTLGIAESRDVAYEKSKVKSRDVVQAIQEELAIGNLGRTKLKELVTALVQDACVGTVPVKAKALTKAQEGDKPGLISPLVLKKHGIARCAIEHIYDLLCQDEDTGVANLGPSTSDVAPSSTFLSYKLGKLDELPGDGIDRRLQVEYIGIDKWHTLANLHTFVLLIRVGYFHGEDLEGTMGRAASDEHIICTTLGFRDNWTDSRLTDGTLYGYTLKPSTITYLDNERLVLEIALDVQVG